MGCLAALCLAVGLLICPSAARAAGGGTFALQVTHSRAPYFVIRGHPGRTLTGQVTVINVSTRPGGVSLYPTDATTGETSGAVYESAQAPRRDVGAWIHLARSHLTLGPRQSEVVPFRVVIPRGARAGQHLGGIAAAPDVPRATLHRRRGKAAFRVKVRELAIIAVQLDLPGPLTRRLAITGIRAGTQPGYQTLSIGLASTGTALTKGTGAITVTDSHGRERLHQSFALDTFVPHTQIDYPVHVHGPALPAGRYSATITVTAGGRRETRRLAFAITDHSSRQTFGSTPTVASAPGKGRGGTPIVLIVAGGVLVLLVGITLGARLRVRRPAKT